jgi:predicted DNA-binding transcriptional regulator AlpA
VHPLVGASEIAALLGVTRQRVNQLSKQPDFPAPVARLGSGAVWRTEDVQRWINRHRPNQ